MTSSQTSSEPGRHYDRVTEGWRLIFGDELHYGVFDDPGDDLATATGRLTSLMVDTAAAITAGAEVLDVGSGTGVIACGLGAERGARILGITTSEVGVESGRARASELGVADRVRFEQRDGTANGLPDSTFDVVWVLESSHLMRQRERLIAECARVLRPGGRICLCDLMLQRDLEFAEVKLLRKELALLRDVFGDAHMERMARYVDWMTAHGLSVDVSTDLTARTRPTFERWRANIVANDAQVTELLGSRGRDDFWESTYVLERLWDDGIMGYGILGAQRAASAG
ncbi:MAG TPA: methyltransferase domain-containing protein [Mycobacteriales bacterium]|nr:methyltransferase domain-containing protein [Mycobacteriales bacterium]